MIFLCSLRRLPLVGLYKKRGATEGVNPSLEVDTVFAMGRLEQLASEAVRWVVVGIKLKGQKCLKKITSLKLRSLASAARSRRLCSTKDN
jgi:hypothetical protein